MATYNAEDTPAGTPELAAQVGKAAYDGAETIVRFSYFMRARDSLGTWVAWFAGAADFLGGGYASASPTPVGAMATGSVQVVSVR